MLASLMTMLSALLFDSFESDWKSFVRDVPIPNEPIEPLSDMDICTSTPLTGKADFIALFFDLERFVDSECIRVDDRLLLVVDTHTFVNLLCARSVDHWVTGVLSESRPPFCPGFVFHEVLM